MNIQKFLSIIIAMAIGTAVSFSKVIPTPVFSDNMVLQQQSKAAIWGEATPGKKVKISASWSKSKFEAYADENGKWFTRISTPKAGGPYRIVLDDGERTVIDNVLIGEVWLCAGQSNMEMPIKGFNGQPVKGSAETILNAKPEIPVRHCYVKRETSLTVRDKCTATWTENTPKDVAEASALAYFFASKLHDVLGVPVGVINVSWGGSCIEAWMSKELLDKEFAGEMDMRAYELGRWPKDFKGFVPACLYNAMLHPLAPYTVKGFIWYQGCNNRNRPEQYRRLQPAFVKMLRDEWGDDSLPFYFTQIAPFKYGGTEDDPRTGYFMWAQAQTLEKIPHSGMATTVDVGEANCIHAADKATPAHRLAYLALTKDYGISGPDVDTPVAESFAFGNGTATVTFRCSPQGLSPISTDLHGFELAGADHVFHPATARIDDNDCKVIHVRSDEVKTPVMVRYCMKNWFVPTLFNCFGIPASPFRSDDQE